MIVRINIDGVNCEVKEGDILLNIFHNLDIFIPHMCYLHNSSPVGKCGLCIVEIDNKKIALSCLTKAKEGMYIKTDTDILTEIRKKNIKRLLENHNIECLKCPKNGFCKLQIYGLKFCLNSNSFFLKKQNIISNHKTIELGKNLKYDDSKCINCKRCSRFLTKISDQKTLPKIDSISNFKDYGNLTSNSAEVCPTAALIHNNDNTTNEPKSLAFCTIKQTLDISDIFTPKIYAYYSNNKLEQILSYNSIPTKDETKNIPKELSERKKNLINYKEILENLATEIKSNSSEKKVFLIGDNVDITTIYYIKYIYENIKNVLICFNDCNIPINTNFEIGLKNADLESMDFCIFVGNIQKSDIYNLINLSYNLKKYISLELEDLNNFLDNNNIEYYQNPFIFISFDIYNNFTDEFIENTLNNFKKEYSKKFLIDINIHLMPKNITQMLVSYIPEYIIYSKLLTHFNKHDIRFICSIGKNNSSFDLQDIKVIHISPFYKKCTEYIRSKHFFEDDSFYLNIFNKTIKTKKILESDLKSNRDIIFDLSKLIFQDNFYDINNEIHQNIKEQFFT